MLHVGDVHGHVHSYLSGSRSPLSVLRGFAERRRFETGGRALFLDAGDDLEKGSLAEIRSRGEATLHLVDRLGLDARTLGNHDFAWGLDSVLRQTHDKPYAVLASNLRGEGLSARRSAVFQVGCARIGVFGLVTNPYDETDDRIDAPYLGAVSQEHDPADADRYVGVATRLVRELREEQAVDAVIALDHLGLARDRVLVDAVPGLDLVISAHDHVAIAGTLPGRHGALVSSGSWLGARSDARVGETTLEIDVDKKAARVLSSVNLRLEELGDRDEGLQAEVDRVVSCFAPDAEKPIVDVDAAFGPLQVDVWAPLLDAAVRARFPEADAIFYEAWTWGGIVRGDLPRGPIGAQALADFAFSERQKAGGPGFTAFEQLEISGTAMRDLCAATLREAPGRRMHRVCPSEIVESARYRLAIERRPLHAPHLALLAVPKTWPAPPADESAAVEVMDLLIDYAKARGAACKALERDAPAPCR
ncbi:MAG: metallophosphoesterase [Deltaproteobacteria bacterium]|nr:metallophosphoesterase [Deltaproteobacteria bacterium]